VVTFGIREPAAAADRDAEDEGVQHQELLFGDMRVKISDRG
jgi:hypothetical protein